MKIQLIFTSIVLASAIALAVPNFGDSASAFAKQSIVCRIQIHKISDLNFGEASPGDGPKTIAPGTAENRENASFQIDGEPHRAFQIILPGRNSVKMISGNGGANREILVESFASTPSPAGVLDRAGRSTIFVGATRQAVAATQKPGDYLGQFNVTVVY